MILPLLSTHPNIHTTLNHSLLPLVSYILCLYHNARCNSGSKVYIIFIDYSSLNVQNQFSNKTQGNLSAVASYLKKEFHISISYATYSCIKQPCPFKNRKTRTFQETNNNPTQKSSRNTECYKSMSSISGTSSHHRSTMDLGWRYETSFLLSHYKSENFSSVLVSL